MRASGAHLWMEPYPKLTGESRQPYAAWALEGTRMTLAPDGNQGI